MSTVYPPDVEVERRAVLSDDGLYRYSLIRRWSRTGPAATFIMLNPSTADHVDDDPTIRRCVGFARQLGAAGIIVLNLYAFRTSKPAVLREAERGGVNIVGPDNDRILQQRAMTAYQFGEPLIAAWGANADPARVNQVLGFTGMRWLTALGVTKTGQPRHPLYLPADAQPRPWPAVPGRSAR